MEKKKKKTEQINRMLSRITVDPRHLLLFDAVSTAVTYDKSMKAIRVKVPSSDEEFYLHPATVRRNDRSADSVVCKHL